MNRRLRNGVLHDSQNALKNGRLQTTDGGKPVAVYTVSQELGHSSTRMVVCLHGGDVRPWGEVVESASRRSDLAPAATPRS